jgi:hemolysin activation/secretion protein
MPEERQPKLTEDSPVRLASLRIAGRRLIATVAFAVAAPLAHAQPEPSAEPTDTPAPAGEAATPGEAAAEEKFDVWEYRVLGSSVLARKSVERALYQHLGPQKTIADVETARQALETAYRSAGYSTVFVDIPEQTVDSGVVRLAVTEGRLDRLRVSGARYFSNRQILARLPSLEPGQVPHFPDVQGDLAALNRETPDRSVTPVLRAGRYPGTVDMELKVMDDLPFHGSFEVNDRYTADTTELRSNLTLGYDNLWQRNHSASLQYQVAPEEPDEAKVIAATYIARLERADAILAMYAVDSDSDVAAVGTLSVLGKGQIFGVRGIRPLDAIGPYFHSVTLGIDFKDFDENIRLSLDDGLRTAIKYVNWSANYGFGWTFPKSTSQFSFGTSWGMRGAGNDDAEFEEKRFKARANYAYLTGSAEHARQVFGDARFIARLAWQYANAPLISNEQFSAGGAASVRGYLEAERLGDLGASMSVELQSPQLAKGDRIKELRLLGFYDAGSLRLLEPLPDQDSVFRLSSAGIGFRFVGFGGLQTEIDWARVLRDGANVLEGDDRVHFRLSYGF